MKFFSSALLLLVSAASAQTPPVAERRPYSHHEHGIERKDDYHWLKQKDDPAVKAYLEAENTYAESFLAPLASLQEQLLKEFRGRVVDEDVSVPVKKGRYVYFAKFPAGKDYEMICRKPYPDGAEEVLIDHNEFAREGATYLYGSSSVSPDENYIAWKENHDGTDIFTLRIRDLKTGKMLADEISGTAFMMEPIWANDSQTLFYTEPDETQRSFRLKRHTLGQPVSADVTLYEEADGRFDLNIFPTTDRKYLVILISSTNTSESRFIPLDSPLDQPRVFSPRRDGIRYNLTHHHTQGWFIISNDGGTNGVFLRTSDDKTDAANWQTVWPYQENVFMQFVDAYESRVVIGARQNGVPGLFLVDPDTMKKQWVTAPVEGASFYTEATPEYTSTAQRVSFESFITPYTVADVDLADGSFSILKRKTVPSGFDPEKYEIKHETALAADGVKIPIWMVLPKNRTTGKPVPILLDGYGSYGTCNDPFFDANYLSLLDRGIGIAFAQPRGGGEFGRTWHDAGKVIHKETTFTDYIACAEHLIKAGYTSAPQLIGYGVSAGGLVAGYSINERPDLFKAFIADVPFVDALNTQLDSTLPLVTGEYEEWGDPADEAAFNVLQSYAPYENVRAQNYPALFVTAGWNDPRVMYWEPAKWVAKIRATNTGNNPILFITQFESGHGGTSGRYGQLNDVAKRYAFMLKVLGMN